MSLKQADIAQLIPHAGSMCLLEAVTQWDANGIRCTSTTHLDPRNPLRLAGRLHAACAIEYAAQAMAAHGGLCALGSQGERPRAGYLLSLRNVRCAAVDLDAFAGELVVDASKLADDDASVLYAFSVTVGAAVIAAGQAMVVLDTARLTA